MYHLVSRDNLLARITDAINDEEDFVALRNFIFNYYSADDDYVFESKELEMIFAVLASYLEFEEAYGDSERAPRLIRLKRVLEQESTPESVLVAIEYDRVSSLLEKLKAGVISEFTFEAQLRKLSPVNVSWNKVLEFHKSHPELNYSP